MWTTIFVAIDRKHADKLLAKLQQEGFMVKLKKDSSGEIPVKSIEIQALESEAEDAQSVLIGGC